VHIGGSGIRMVITNMNFKQEVNFDYGEAICYSGYREGQSPAIEKFPSEEQIEEDLLILNKHWKYIRLYDPNQHAKTVLQIIRSKNLNLKVLLGVCLFAEINNDNCPWSGGTYTEEQLAANRTLNQTQIGMLIDLANQYPDIIFAVSAGNEATVEWTDHLVSVEKIIQYVRMIKQGTHCPVTFCENYVPWQNKLSPLVREIDFISLHTYPLWESKSIDGALAYTIENYECVKKIYPDKTVVITEAGWATVSNGRGFPQENANEEYQESYIKSLTQWSREKGILTFVFEAFDEDWKGSPDLREPEKHWGLFTINRKPKKVMTQ